MSDEDPKKCNKNFRCGFNEARCGVTTQCRPIEKFCDGNLDCPDNSDEWNYCSKL